METTWQEFDGIRNKRFGEILVFRKAHIDVYNTTPVNDCPAELWDPLDVDELKHETRAHRVFKNGPHYWMMDRMGASWGEPATFGRLETRWAAKLGLDIAVKAARGTVPFEVFTPKKTQLMVYAAGKEVYELVDPDGHVYVLQARDEEHAIETLADLGEKMSQIPEGWSYRTRTLDEDLVFDLHEDQTVYAVGDEWKQYYTRIPEGA
jgi:hypothetical protein